VRPDELSELKEHMQTCADCRDFVGDIGVIVGEKIPELTQRRSPTLEKPVGMTDRFIARAHSQGIPLKKSKKSEAKPSKHAGFALFAAAIIATILAIALWLKIVKAGPPSSQPGVKEPAAQMLGRPASGGEPTQDSLQPENAELRQRLQDARARLDSLTAKLRSDQEALKVAAVQNSQTSSRLPAVEEANAELRKRLVDRDTQLAQFKGDLDKVESEQEAGRIASQVEEAELSTLRDKVAKLTSELQESEQLSDAANQAKELIGARNLHIVDVDDTDENGRRQRPFGRIFLAEGKKLVFYAYDLHDPRKLNAKINFYVWGSREGVNQPVKSLGIFHADEANDARWVLTFDDPNVLAQINCVFVTAESAKKVVMQPTGRQILFASLGKANHP
jgi:hypothetical protein